jgi:diguanylate cyclase (GGDEF)-like protein/PAS domain S-box-containing protein
MDLQPPILLHLEMGSAMFETNARIKEQVFLKQILENSPDGIFTIDFELHIRYVNSAFCRLVNYTEQELTGSFITEHLGDIDILNACMKLIEETGECNDQETVFKRRDGSMVHVSKNVRTIKDDAENVTGMLITVRDLSKLHQLNKALEIAKQQLKQHADELEKSLTEREQALYLAKELAEVTLASIGDGVITTDVLGRVTFLNPIATNLTGWTLDEAQDKPLSDIFNIINEVSRHRIDNPVGSVLRDGKTVTLANHTVLISRQGTEYNIEDSAAPIFKPDGSLMGCVLVFHDVTEKHRLLNTTRWQATHDTLTNLPNRVLLSDRFNHATVRSQRQQNLLAVCIIDLDEFKPVNDRYGHDIGDVLLIEVAKRLTAIVRGDDTVARLGGDEFVLLLSDVNDVDELELIMARVLVSLSMPYFIHNKRITISASIGATLYPLDQSDTDTLLRHADQAMYQAKQRGRNQYNLFDIVLDRQVTSSHQTLKQIKKALESNAFVLYYQPKVNMRTGVIVGMEALLRWQHPTQGMILPLDFLPQVEQTNLIIDIGVWVMDQAMQQISVWLKAGKSWVVSINIAALHFHSGDFLQHLKDALAHYPNVPAHLLEIEILESVALNDINQINQLIRDCQALGVSFSLDDFGTGYSSLSYLKQLPAETIKIDQAFVRDILDDSDDLTVVEAVINIGKVFNRKIIAEGVETTGHGVLLLRLGCDLAQGFGIARPMPAIQVLNWANAYVAAPAWSQCVDADRN